MRFRQFFLCLAVASPLVALLSPAVSDAATTWTAPALTYAAGQSGIVTTTATWGAPVIATGTISQYVASAVPSDKTKQTVQCTIAGNAKNLNCPLSLSAGLTYSIAVVAQISGGAVASVTSASASAVVTAPAAPSAVSLVGGDGSLIVSWSASSSAGVPPTSSYTASTTTGQSCTSSQTTCTITGLTNLTSYSVSVSAMNVVGSTPSSSVSGSPYKLTNVSNVAGVNNPQSGITVTWSAAGGNPSGKWSYVATAVAGQQSVTCTVSGSTSCTISGLTAGTAYALSVVATWNGQSLAPVLGASPVTVFNAPGSMSVTAVVGSSAGAQSIKVSWTPAVANGSPITQYTVTAKDQASSTVQTVCTVDATQPNPVLSCTATQLVKGDTYLITVTANNGLQSQSTAQAIPYGPSSAPSSITIAATSSQKLDVAWQAPIDNGGAKIFKYIATASDSLGSAAGSCQAVAPATNCQISGLTNGSAYTVQVVAVNGPDGSAGFTSAATTSSGATTVFGPTSPVGNLQLTVGHDAGSGQIVVSWTAPGQNNGAAPTGYVVTATDVTSSAPAVTCSAPAGTLTCTLTGLSNGHTYSVSVVSQNGQTSGATTGNAIPYAAPGQAVNPTLTGGFGSNADGSLLVSWGAAASNGMPVTYSVTIYDVLSQPAGTCSVTQTGATLSCIVTGLTDGQYYTATIVATNGPSSSSSIDITSATLVFGPPSQPTAVSVAAGPSTGSGKLDVSWNAPVATFGAPITKYVVWALASPTSTTPVATCNSTSATACTIKGLTNGSSYYIEVFAYNGPTSFSVSTVTAAQSPYTNPDIVGNVQVLVGTVPGSGNLTVNWGAPASNGRDITSYTILLKSLGTLVGSQRVSMPGSLTYTFRGLQNGTAYDVTITATNAVGSTSVASTPKTATPYGLPQAPSAGSVTNGQAVGSQNLLVSWNLSGDGNGRAVDTYVAAASLGGSAVATCRSQQSTDTSCLISGLVNGSKYSITVTAYNNFAGDPNSNASVTFSSTYNPYTNPDPVTGIAGVVGNPAGSGSIQASWNAPVNNGGNTISNYTATAFLAGSSVKSCSTSGLSCTIKGLANGTSYTLQVVASNGANSTSSASTTATFNPYGAPSAVRAVTWMCIPSVGAHSICASQELIASWQAPAATNGRAITEYLVTLTDTQTNAVVTAMTSPSVLTYDATGLNNGDQYQLTISAVNSDPAATGNNQSASTPASPAVTANPFTLPGAPTVSSVSSPSPNQSGSLLVSWRLANDGGSPITSFSARISSSGAGSGQPCTASGSATSCVITHLQNGTAYTVQVQATNAAGTGPWSSSASGTPNGPPSGPVQVNLTPAPSQITAVEKNLTIVGGTPNADYQTSWDIALSADTPCWIPVNHGSAANPNSCDVSYFPMPVSSSATDCPTTYVTYSAIVHCVVTSLTNGQSYIMRVTVQNSFTTNPSNQTASPSWVSTAPAIPASIPDAPVSVAVTATTSTATITWPTVSSTHNGGSAILSYTVTSVPSGLQCTVPVTDQSAPSATCQISGLTLGVSYTFSVVTTNASGSSAALISKATMIGAASAPPSVSTQALDKGILVSWTAAAPNGFAISQYTATARGSDGSSSQCTAGVLSCIIPVPDCVPSLGACPTYVVSVTASNVVSGKTQTSDATAAPSVVTVYGVPGTPTATTVVALKDSAVVNWTAPSNMGSGITMYVVSAVDQATTGGTNYCTIATPSPAQSTFTCNLQGLSVGHSYLVSVQAFDDVGGGASTATIPATTSTYPIPPVSLTLIGESGDLVAAWTPYPATGDNRATGWTITSTPSGLVCPDMKSSFAAQPSGTVCSGAVPGVIYTISVVATNKSAANALQSSAATVSAPASEVSPLTPPTGAPSTAKWLGSGGPSVLPIAGAVAFAPNGNMFTVGRSSQQVFVTTSSSTTALPLSVALVDPTAVALSPDGSRIFIADSGANDVVVSSVDGSNAQVLPVTLTKSLSGPSGLAASSSTLFIADTGNNRIVAVPLNGGAGRVVGSTVNFAGPMGLAVLSNGNLLVADTQDSQLVQLSTSSGVASVVKLFGPNVDFMSPTSVAVSPDGGTYFVSMDGNNNNDAILEMSATGGNLSLLDNSVVGVGGVAISSTGVVAYSAVRGVFTGQFQLTPAIPSINKVVTKSTLTVTWTSVVPSWGGAWTYTASVVPSTTPSAVGKPCVVTSSGCSVAGLSPSTSYNLVLTVTGASGTTPASYSFPFTTSAK